MAQEQICANDENTILQIDEGDVGRVAIVPYMITVVIMQAFMLVLAMKHG